MEQGTLQLTVYGGYRLLSMPPHTCRRTNQLRRATVVNRTILIPLALLVAGMAGDAQPKVLREFKDAALVELSEDGHLILTTSLRLVKCADEKHTCYSEVLTVYDSTSRKSVGELISTKPPCYGVANRFLTAGFVRQGEVRAVESACDSQRNSWSYALLTWDPISRSERRSPIDFPKDFSYQCRVDEERLLGLGELEVWPPYTYGKKYDPANRVPHYVRRPLKIIAPGAQAETIAVIEDSPFVLNDSFKCKAWRSGSLYLIEDVRASEELEDRGLGKSLAWFNTEPGARSRSCYTFEGERIHGYSISPDSSRIAVITSLRDAPTYRTFLTVLDGGTCGQLSRFDLEFPEKPRSRAPLLAPSKKYLDNVPFRDQFARSIAISADNTLVAVAYGISKGISGLAFFGVYSMSDGHRMATLKGDTFTPNLYEMFELDMYSARGAPIEGALQFSPDSKSLYTSSKNLRQWDISKLH